MKRALLALALLAGCTPDITPGSLIQRTRVIGSRAEVEGEPERAWPRPGEMMTVRFNVADPAVPAPITWGFVACVLEDVRFGLGGCSGDPFAVNAQLTPSTDPDPEPAFTFQVPGEEELDGADILLVVGVVCGEGTPTLDVEMQRGCEGGTPSGGGVVSPTDNLVGFTIPILRGDEPNHQPGIAEVRLRGEAWTYQAPPDAVACPDDPAVPVVRLLDEEVSVAVEPAEQSREEFTAVIGDPPVEERQREELQISSFTTAGELERLYSFVDDESPTDDAVVQWTVPEEGELPPEGLLVRFFFVVRDGRGGAAWAERALCVRQT